MEKKINKFKDTAMVIIKEKYRKPKTKLENLLSTYSFVSAFSKILMVNKYLMQKHIQ